MNGTGGATTGTHRNSRKQVNPKKIQHKVIQARQPSGLQSKINESPKL